MFALRMLVAAAVILPVAAPAFAGEGNGEPFPGPNAVIREKMSATPKYTMGSDAPFNYFYTPTPTRMDRYHAAASASQDPYPFKAQGQTIQTGSQAFPSSHG